MFKQITTFVVNIASQYLCGFRKGYNTQHVLLRLLDKLNKSVDRVKKVGVFTMDLSKAFDCISHDLLIAKLHAYGFHKPSLNFIYSYLKDRKQRVKINAELSSWKDIITGVPQGSVLGPLLFNIFIDELYNFADDNTLSVSDISVERIIHRLEHDIDVLQTWFLHNGMLLNVTKCQFLIVESSKSKRNAVARIKVRDEHIVGCKDGKLLGITFDSNLTMKKHDSQNL